MKNMNFNLSVLLSSALFLAGSASSADIKREDLIRRLGLRATVLVLSEDGKRILSSPSETRYLTGFGTDGKFKRGWTSENTDLGNFYVRHEWTVTPSGEIQVQFDEFANESSTSKLLAHEEKSVVGFGAVTYAIRGIKGKNIVLRFVPELDGVPSIETVDRLRIAGKGISLYDAEGSLWASSVELSGDYVAISTYRGTLLLSYRNFRGAEPAGVASGKRITLRLKEYPDIHFQSETDFVPSGMNVRVYAKYLKEQRTADIHSIRIQDASDEKKWLERVNSFPNR